MVETTLMPRHCLCPNESYTCHVNLGLEIQWISDTTESELDYTASATTNVVYTGGFRVEFSHEQIDFLSNFTSTLLVTDLSVNGTDLTCKGLASRMGIREMRNDSIRICIIGSASAPTITSVVCDSSSAVVSFHPPVYGEECVDYYVVTAISEERNVTYHATSDELTHNCSIPPDSNVNDYNFTVYSVTRGIDGALYNGSIATDCCMPFPESVTAIEDKCGLQRLVKVSWQHTCLMSVNTSISWRRVHNSRNINHNSDGSEGNHLLTLDYSVTGPLEIAVTFSSGVCKKTSVTQYHVEGVVTSVSVSSTTLIIESRDCIGSPDNYSIVATFTNTSSELVNVPLTSSIEHDVGDEVMGNTEYSITVTVVHITSGTVIDERTVMFTTPSEPPLEPGSDATRDVTVVTDCTCCTCGKVDEDKVAFIAVGVSCGVLVGVVVGVVITVSVVAVKKRLPSVRGSIDASINGEKMDAKRSDKSAVYESQGTAVVYETVSDVVAGTGPDTSENVAYGVTKEVVTSYNPAYDVVCGQH